MPKKMKKKKKNTQKNKSRTPSQSEQAELSPKEEIKAYIGAYIDSYMDDVEELNLEEADFPLFYTYYPFDVVGYVLPDHSTCILFKGYADATMIEIKEAEFEEVDKGIAEKEFDHICCYSPSQLYSKKEAEKQAKEDVEKDIELTRNLGMEDVERKEREDALKSIRLLAVLVPWLGARETEHIGLHTTLQTDAAKFALENLGMREGEDFLGYSERVKSLESALLQPSELESPPSEEVIEKAPEPLVPPEEEPPPEEPEVGEPALPAPTPPPPSTPAPAAEPTPALTPEPAPAPTPPVVKEVQSTTKIPIPGAPPGTNISIEIKQPEAVRKDEDYERKENEILRLKKTLYNQTREIKEIEREISKMGHKIEHIEPVRQSVLRMNRKIHDVEVMMVVLEKNGNDLIRGLEDMRVEQRGENKKTRRFISEKAKKARNQAMIVAIVALVLSLISLPFVIMLLIRFWNEIKGMIGL